MKATFKVHKIQSTPDADLVWLHWLDPHEIERGDGVNEFARDKESRSGEGGIKIKITAPEARGKYAVSQLVTVDISAIISDAAPQN